MEARWWVGMAAVIALGLGAASGGPRTLATTSPAANAHAGPAGVSESMAKGDLALGQAVYEEICFACHGEAGDGKGPSWLNTMPRPQAFVADYTTRLTDRYMFEVVKYGKTAVLNRQVPDSPLEALAMPSFGHLFSDQEIRELIAFERAFGKGAPQSPEWREIFIDACAPCHGTEGRGDGPRASPEQPAPRQFVSDAQPAPANYHDPLFMARFSDDYLLALIKHGKVGASEVAGFDAMKPYGHVLSDEEIWSVVRYIRETFIRRARTP